MTLRRGVLQETTPSGMAASRFNTITDNCVRQNSLLHSGYGIGFGCRRSLVQILPRPYISAMYLFICFFVTDLVHKNIVGKGESAGKHFLPLLKWFLVCDR